MKKKKNWYNLLLILLSLILHIILILLLFINFPDMHTQENKSFSLPDNEIDNEWVSRTARSSPLILFTDPPYDHQPLEPAPIPEDNPEQSAPIDQTTDSDTRATQETAQPEPIIQEIDKSTTQTCIIPSKKDIQQNQDVQQHLKHVPNAPLPTKRRLTMTDVVSGFLRHLKEPGNAAFDVVTQKKGLATDEQIKHERYIQKIFHCLQISGKYIGYQPPTKGEDQVGIILMLRRDGRLQEASIAQPSGNPALDQYVLEVIQNAANTFPPVPSYLQGNPYILPFNWVFTRYM